MSKNVKSFEDFARMTKEVCAENHDWYVKAILAAEMNFDLDKDGRYSDTGNKMLREMYDAYMANDSIELVNEAIYEMYPPKHVSKDMQKESDEKAAIKEKEESAAWRKEYEGITDNRREQAMENVREEGAIINNEREVKADDGVYVKLPKQFCKQITEFDDKSKDMKTKNIMRLPKNFMEIAGRDVGGATFYALNMWEDKYNDTKMCCRFPGDFQIRLYLKGSDEVLTVTPNELKACIIEGTEKYMEKEAEKQEIKENLKVEQEKEEEKEVEKDTELEAAGIEEESMEEDEDMEI